MCEDTNNEYSQALQEHEEAMNEIQTDEQLPNNGTTMNEAPQHSLVSSSTTISFGAAEPTWMLDLSTSVENQINPNDVVDLNRHVDEPAAPTIFDENASILNNDEQSFDLLRFARRSPISHLIENEHHRESNHLLIEGSAIDENNTEVETNGQKLNEQIGNDDQAVPNNHLANSSDMPLIEHHSSAMMGSRRESSQLQSHSLSSTVTRRLEYDGSEGTQNMHNQDAIEDGQQLGATNIVSSAALATQETSVSVDHTRPHEATESDVTNRVEALGQTPSIDVQSRVSPTGRSKRQRIESVDGENHAKGRHRSSD